MSILVVGGTGTVGSQIVSRLLDQGDEVRVMTHSADKLATMPADVAGVVGDLSDPPSLQRAFGGVESLVLITAVHPDETARGQFAVKAAKKAGIKRIVFMSVVMPPGSERIPHFASKIPIEQAIKESGMAYTILRPNNFFQNDLIFREAIVKYGVYPQPIGSAGLNRVDVRDIADAAVNSLRDSGHEGKTYDLNGTDVLTGKGVATVYSRHLGTEVNYGGDDLDSWAEQASAMLPVWMVHDFRIMYQFFQGDGLRAAQSGMAKTELVLHHPPRSFDAFVAETVSLWKQAAK
jgi:uncharacterized protein YbjT (DUF2867 family)